MGMQILVQGILCAVIENYIFGTCYKDMASEVDEMHNLIFRYKPSLLFIDSYYVTEGYLKVIHIACIGIGCRMVYNDDVAAFPYECDVLINYNIYGIDWGNRYYSFYGGIRTPRMLFGTSYAPLRKEFQGLPDRIAKKKAEAILASNSFPMKLF